MERHYYYPFGMVMPGRKSVGTSDYRFGFSGRELDKIINVDNYDFGARIYDGRIGRWLSVDPLSKKFPSWGSYTFAIDNPINFLDFDGREIKPVRDERYVYEYEVKSILGERDVMDQILPNPRSVHGFGVTTVKFFERNAAGGYSVGDLSYTLNDKTKKYDVVYKTHRFINKGLEEKGVLDKLNPGLRDEVREHEEGHVKQFDETINKSYTISSGLTQSKTDPQTGIVKATSEIKFTGQVDEILDQAAKLYDNNKQLLTSKGVTKKMYMDGVFLNTVAAMRQDMQNKSAPQSGPLYNPDTQPLETDANARAAKALKAKGIVMQYLNGKVPTNTGSGILDLGNIIKTIFKPKK